MVILITISVLIVLVSGILLSVTGELISEIEEPDTTINNNTKDNETKY